MNERSPAQRIAIIAFSKISSDGRVLRQIQSLSRSFQLSVIGYGKLPGYGNVVMRPLEDPNLPANLSSLQKLMRRMRTGKLLPYFQIAAGKVFPSQAYEAWYWSRPDCQQAYRHLLDSQPTIIHANDWLTLPLAILAARQVNARVVADLHEYAPLELDGFLWRTFLQPMREYVLRRYMPDTVASITVNHTIAEKYHLEYGFRPIVVMNAPLTNPNIRFKPTDPDHIHLIHHGGLAKGRNPEIMIDTVAQLEPRFHMNFMLVGEQSAITALHQYSKEAAPGRVTFHQAVQPDQVTLRISNFDIGFYLLPTNTFNNSAASPNKFFEFIHAGLAICIGPSPEMTRMCEQYGFGIVAPSFEPQQVARLLNQMDAAGIDQLKHAAFQARMELNAETELAKLVRLYEDLAKERA